MIQNVSPNLRRDLILSLGTHRGSRRLSPVEAAAAIDATLKAGASFSDIASLVHFDSTSTIREIHRLLQLSPDVQHLIGWGRQHPPVISMTTASQIGRLQSGDDQSAAVEAIIAHNMSSDEARQLVETRIHSQSPMPDCINRILKLRPRIIRKYLLVGVVTSEIVAARLRDMTQEERDRLLRNAVTNNLGKLPEWSGRLGISRFHLLGDEEFALAIKGLPNGFESAMNFGLEAELSRQ